MDLSKKRKTDDNGVVPYIATATTLSPEDIDKILNPFTKEQLIPILRSAVLRDPVVFQSLRTLADSDPAQRKLFVRGLGWETTTEKLRSTFSSFGDLDDSNTIVITDKVTGKSKGYGFVTFRHIDGALLALKEPNKKIDGRMTVTTLASAGNSGGGGGGNGGVDVSSRKIYVGNVPFEISSERLLGVFSMFGEIEEGPLGFDKQSGKARGFAFFVYKTEEGARLALVEPMKMVDGHQLLCKLATDNKKVKPGGGPPVSVEMMHNSMTSYGPGGGGYSSYGPGPGHGMTQQPQPVLHQNVGGYGMGGHGEQGGQGYGGGYASHYGAPGGPGFGVAGIGSGGGYRPGNAVGTQGLGGGYMDGSGYGLQGGYPSQPSQPGGGPGPRLPGYQGMPPPYY